MDTITPTQTDLAYAAGFIDGEGCFFIGARRKKRSYDAVLVVANNHHAPLDRLQSFFGGCISEPRPDHFHWRICANSLRRLLPDLIPYLMIKQPEAKVMLDFVNLHRPSGIRPTDELLKQQELLRIQLQELKYTHRRRSSCWTYAALSNSE